MGSLHFLIHLLVISLLMLCSCIIAQTGIHAAERDALLTLADELNSPFLHNNWTNIKCYTLVNPPKWYGINCSNGRVAELVLENMGLTGIIKPDRLASLTELSVLSFKNNSISGNMMDFSQNQKMSKIDLSSNMFDGLISDSLPNLDLLESLQLQNNNLTGSIPVFNQSSLKEFNVSNNKLSGAIPNTTVLQSFNDSSYSGNSGLCGLPSSTVCNINTSGPGNDQSPPSGGESPVSRFAPFLLVVDVVGFVVVVLLFMIYCRKSGQLRNEMRLRTLAGGGGVRVEKVANNTEVSEKSEGNIEVLGGERGGGGAGADGERGKLTFMDGVERGFGLNDLLKASAEGLGKGNFGNCYKAMVDDGPAVVVKRLRDLRPLTHGEFVKQLQAMADLKHPNLLPLLAYYYSKEEKLLVNKLASNGNVYNRIHGGRGTKDRVPFRWNARLSIARGVARAMDYLHLNPKSESATVPHGNLKSSNVLLDENDMVLVSDYGLTSLISLPIAAQRMVSYKSPEFQSYKKVSKKSDVWSFGCLLLELLTGRVSTHSAPPGVNGVDLCGWVHRAVREEWTAEIFDVEIAVQRSANHSMLRLLQIAIRCCEKAPEKRPEMTEVVREVENIRVVVDSEDDEDLSSLDQSLTDDSISATPSMIMNGDDR